MARSLTRQATTSSILVRPGENGGLVLTPPSLVASDLNQRFPMEDQGDLYFTMFYGTLNIRTGELRYVSAGHPPAVLFRGGGAAPELLPAEGFAIGWFEDIDYDEETVQRYPQAIDCSYFPMACPRPWTKIWKNWATTECWNQLPKPPVRVIDDAVAHVKQTVDQWCRVNGPKDDVSILAVEMPSVG